MTYGGYIRRRGLGGVQGGGSTPQDTQNSTLIRTRPLGPIRGDAAPFDSKSGPVSATALYCFGRQFMLVMNLEVRPIVLEIPQDYLSNKKRITQFGVHMRKLSSFEVRYISAVRICVQNVKNLVSSFSSSQGDMRELLE